MEWPFRRRGVVEGGAITEPEPVLEPPPTGEWASLPPLRASFSPMLTASNEHFVSGLAAHRPPEKFLGSLGHAVTPDGPSGLVRGMATIAPVQRRAAGPARVDAPDRGLSMSVQTFPARPRPPTLVGTSGTESVAVAKSPVVLAARPSRPLTEAPAPDMPARSLPAVTEPPTPTPAAPLGATPPATDPLPEPPAPTPPDQVLPPPVAERPLIGASPPPGTSGPAPVQRCTAEGAMAPSPPDPLAVRPLTTGPSAAPGPPNPTIPQGPVQGATHPNPSSVQRLADNEVVPKPPTVLRSPENAPGGPTPDLYRAEPPASADEMTESRSMAPAAEHKGPAISDDVRPVAVPLLGQPRSADGEARRVQDAVASQGSGRETPNRPIQRSAGNRAAARPRPEPISPPVHDGERTSEPPAPMTAPVQPISPPAVATPAPTPPVAISPTVQRSPQDIGDEAEAPTLAQSAVVRSLEPQTPPAQTPVARAEIPVQDFAVHPPPESRRSAGARRIGIGAPVQRAIESSGNDVPQGLPAAPEGPASTPESERSQPAPTAERPLIGRPSTTTSAPAKLVSRANAAPVSPPTDGPAVQRASARGSRPTLNPAPQRQAAKADEAIPALPLADTPLFAERSLIGRPPATSSAPVMVPREDAAPVPRPTGGPPVQRVSTRASTPMLNPAPQRRTAAPDEATPALPRADAPLLAERPPLVHRETTGPPEQVETPPAGGGSALTAEVEVATPILTIARSAAVQAPLLGERDARLEPKVQRSGPPVAPGVHRSEAPPVLPAQSRLSPPRPGGVVVPNPTPPAAPPVLRFAETLAPAPPATPVQTSPSTAATAAPTATTAVAPFNVQREMSNPPEPAPDTLPAPVGEPAEFDVDDLAERLYPALADRLKTELRRDRDRAGLLTGL